MTHRIQSATSTRHTHPVFSKPDREPVIRPIIGRFLEPWYTIENDLQTE